MSSLEGLRHGSDQPMAHPVLDFLVPLDVPEPSFKAKLRNSVSLATMDLVRRNEFTLRMHKEAWRRWPNRADWPKDWTARLAREGFRPR